MLRKPGRILLCAVVVLGGCSEQRTPSAPTAPSEPVTPVDQSAAPAVPAQPPATDPAADSKATSSDCDASGATWAVGQAAGGDVLERARMDAGAAQARFLRPGQMISKEYLSTRLNLDLDAADIVIAVRCG